MSFELCWQKRHYFLLLISTSVQCQVTKSLAALTSQVPEGEVLWSHSCNAPTNRRRAVSCRALFSPGLSSPVCLRCHCHWVLSLSAQSQRPSPPAHSTLATRAVSRSSEEGLELGLGERRECCKLRFTLGDGTEIQSDTHERKRWPH